jgi:UDP-N-acetylmuramate--alanine ligase
MPVADRIDLGTPRSIHVVGVGGAGMSAIATVLAGMGHRVSGSDLKDSVGLERLRALGVEVFIGHADTNIAPDVDYVAISTAIPERNLEVRVATERGIPVLRRAEILAAVAATRSTVAVAGTHGKTTSASMLAVVLTEAGLSPSFIIGGEVNEIGTGAVWDSGEWFVVEADESDGTFLELPRRAAIVTNVEPDHLEFYGSAASLEDAFARFVAETAERCLVCADDEAAARLGAEHGALSYGTAEEADYRMIDLDHRATGSSFAIEYRGDRLGTIRLPVPGAHNARNAAAAVAMAMMLGASFEAARTALGRFGGVARRFEHRGQVDGVTFVDDYAHLPTEVRAALEAAADGGPDRLVCIFQPHRYSRTATLWPDFADAFDRADLLVVTDVYAAGESPRPGISGKLVAQAVLDEHPWRRLAYLPRLEEVVRFLSSELRPGDLCLTLGAGDITSLPDLIQEAIRGRRRGSAA